MEFTTPSKRMIHEIEVLTEIIMADSEYLMRWMTEASVVNMKNGDEATRQ